MLKTRTRLKVALLCGVAVIVGLAVFAFKRYNEAMNDPTAIVAPPEYINAATNMAELRNQGRFDDAVNVGLHSLTGKHDDFIFQMIATVYFVRALHDKDHAGEWTKLAAEYSTKALDANPTDLANIFNVGVNYVVAGDELDTGGCEYYRRALAIFNSLSPRLHDDRAQTQGRSVRLAPFRTRNEDELSRVRGRLSHCQPPPDGQ